MTFSLIAGLTLFYYSRNDTQVTGPQLKIELTELWAVLQNGDTWPLNHVSQGLTLGTQALKLFITRQGSNQHVCPCLRFTFV